MGRGAQGVQWGGPGQEDLGHTDDPLWAPWQVILMPSIGLLAPPTHSPTLALGPQVPGPRMLP